jgi:hypothetical protein
MTTRNRELASIIDDSGNITTGGNLSVTGNLTQSSSTTTTYSDGLLELNTGAGSNSNDLGLVMERGSTGNNAIFLWDESNDGFAVGTTTATGSATGNISFSAAPFTASTITGTILNGSTSVRTPLIEYTDGDDALTIADGGAVTTSQNFSIGGSNNELRFYEGSNYVGFEAPALSADKIWVLPAADGSSGQLLKTDGSGNLSFTDDLTLANASVNNYSGNGSTTGFTLSTTPVSENATQVYINGVYQFKNTYAVSGTTLTFDTAPANGSSIEALVWSTVAINVPADASVTNAKLNASIITGQSEVTAADADHVLIYDASSSALKKTLVSDLLQTSEEIQDIVGAMFSSNTETGIAATYQDGDGTIDLVLDAAQTAITSLGTLTGLTGGTGDLVWDSPTFAVDSSENRVGIGTASPLGLLHVDSSAKTEILLEGTQTSNGEIVDISFRNASDSVAAIQVLRVSNNDQADMAFFTQPNSGSVTERMRIASDGAITIPGTLGVTGVSTFGGGTSISTAGVLTLEAGGSLTTASGNDLNIVYPDSRSIFFKEGSTTHMVLDNAGKLGIGNGTNDPGARLLVKSLGGGTELVFKTTDASDNMVFEVQGGGKAHFNYGPVLIGSTTDVMHANMDDLQVGHTSGNKGITIVSGTSNYGTLAFADGSSGNAAYRGFVEYFHNDDTMRLGAAGAERMRITMTGGVLVGTSTNQLYDTTSQTGIALHDTNSYASCGAHIEMANSADSGWSLQYLQRFNWNSGDDGRFLQFAINGGSDVGTISYNGTDFAIAQGSDYRLKENIVDYTGGLAKINALKVRSFNKKEGASKDITQQGFIAHELSEHIPNAVIGTKDAMKVDETGETVPDYQQVTRETLVPYLVSAIQELEARVKELEG